MLTAEEQTIRATGIGSSEIAAIIGESPYATAWDVWLRKTGRAVSESNARTEAGHGLEEWIAQTAARQINGCKSLGKGTTRVHPRHSWAVATPDYYALISDDLAEYDAIVECKAVGFRVRHQWGEGVPAYVQAQVQWQMEVCDIDRTFVAAHLDGTSVDVFTVDRDKAVAAWLLDKASAFWEANVVCDAPPDPDGSKAAGEWLRSRLKTGTELAVKPGTMLETALRGLRETNDTLRRAKADKERWLQDMLALSDGAARLVLPEGDVVRLSQQRGKVRWTEVVRDLQKQLGLSKAEAEEIAEGYRGKPSVRVTLPRSWGAEENDSE